MAGLASEIQAAWKRQGDKATATDRVIAAFALAGDSVDDTMSKAEGAAAWLTKQEDAGRAKREIIADLVNGDWSD